MASSNLPAFEPNVPPRPRNWFDKNWKWFVPTLIIAVLAIITAFVFALILFVGSLFRQSYPYQFAVERAKESPEVAERIGEPIKFGWIIAGQLNYAGSNGDASFQIPISGPKGRGTIEVAAKKRAGRWQFQTLEVDIPGSDEPIPLLNGQPGPSDDASPDST